MRIKSYFNITRTRSIGGEYHLKGTTKFSPYIGGDLFYGFGVLSKNRTNYDGSNWTINYVIWNMSVNRSFLKTGNLLFGIEAYDILNQNVSNFRSVNNNVIVDQRTNIIRRYFMAKMTLKFNNNKTKEVEDDWF